MRTSKSAYVLALVIFLTGCKANQDSLSEFVSEVEAQARKDVANLDPSVEFTALSYSTREQREPFALPKAALVQSQPVAKTDCWQPKHRTKTGKLERYPLSQLRLKGVMGSSGSVAGLVQTPSGNVVKIKAGQYIGLNNGRVSKVTHKYVLINETLPDGLGCWQKRNVKFALK